MHHNGGWNFDHPLNGWNPIPHLFIALQKQREAQRRQEASALALQKANEGLEQRVLDRTRELSVLYDVTSVASQALDLKTTMAQCLDRVVEVMQGDVGTIHLVDETGQILRLATSRDSPPRC